MKRQLDMDRIARGLGAERRGKVRAAGGYFGAAQLAAEVEHRFKSPAGGGRATDPKWTERRLVPLAPRTLARLEHLADEISEQSSKAIEPLQLAALMLEKSAEKMTAESAAQLLRKR